MGIPARAVDATCEQAPARRGRALPSAASQSARLSATSSSRLSVGLSQCVCLAPISRVMRHWPQLVTKCLAPVASTCCLLHLEHLVAQWRGALVGHHAATATAAVAGDAMVLQLDQLEAQRRQHAARRRFQPAAAHDLAGVVEGRRLADLLDADLPGGNQLVQKLGHVDDAHRQRLAVPLGRFPARGAVGMAAFGQQHGLGADLHGGIDQRAREPLLQFQVAVVEADVGGVKAALVHRPAARRCG